MKNCSIITLSASVALFMISLSLSEPVQASQADVEYCKGGVAWDAKRGRVKNKDRRKFMGCLASHISDRKYQPSSPQTDKLEAHARAVAEGYQGCSAAFTTVRLPPLNVNFFKVVSDKIKSQYRRKGISCLTEILESLPLKRDLPR